MDASLVPALGARLPRRGPWNAQPIDRIARDRRRSPEPAEMIREFEQLTHRPLAWPALENLPATFLEIASLSPGEVLAVGQERLSRRTVNALRRQLSRQDSTGPWTYGRLIQIRGFGFASLLEVLRLEASLRAQGQRGVPMHRQLDEELSRLVARNHDRFARAATPMLDRAVALIAGVLPASEEAIARRLRAAGLVRQELDLGRFERALRFRDPPCPFVFFRRPNLSVVVARDQLERARLVHERALRALAFEGSSTIEQVAALAGTNDHGFVRAVLTAKADLEWLGRGQRRFRLRRMARPAA